MEYDKDTIKEILSDLSDRELFEAYNEYASENNYGQVYRMGDFDEVFAHKSPSDILRDVRDDFDLDNSYFMVDGYGHVYSNDDLQALLGTQLDDMAQSCEREQETYGVDELQDLLEMSQEEELES